MIEPPWRQFAGLSQNYVVVYLKTRAEPGTQIVESFGGGQPIRTWLSPVRIREPTAAELEETEICRQARPP